ncbi:MAG: alpha/beta hydrolase [Dehalococcoidales bacterium]|nr:alpha/beta hydrolase [Dehalococcoidales bacterium]
MNKRTKKILKITAIVISALLVIYVGLSVYSAKEVMEIPRLPLVDVGQELGVPFQDVSFPTRGDNLTLKGWFAPGERDEVIIILHGGFQNRVDDNVNTLDLVHDLALKGYNVLTYDLRGRGESEGASRALSYIDEDVGGAVDYVQSRGFKTKNIYLLGFCSGAAAACIYASHNDVGKVILDGCFIDVPTMLIRQANSVGVPSFLAASFIPGTYLFTRIIYHYDMVNCIDVVPLIKCPVLFIHEENDEFITLDEVEALFKASTNPASRIWEVPDAEHSQSYKTHPLEYIEKVDYFLTSLIIPS